MEDNNQKIYCLLSSDDITNIILGISLTTSMDIHFFLHNISISKNKFCTSIVLFFHVITLHQDYISFIKRKPLSFSNTAYLMDYDKRLHYQFCKYGFQIKILKSNSKRKVGLIMVVFVNEFIYNVKLGDVITTVDGEQICLGKICHNKGLQNGIFVDVNYSFLDVKKSLENILSLIYH